MAGRTLHKKILKHFGYNGGADYLFERIASGETLTSIAKQFGCSRAYLSRTLNEVPIYRQTLIDARVEAADSLVEGGLAMVDSLSSYSTSNEIASTREKVNYRKFMAGSMNQGRYGTKPQTNIQLSVGELHLDSLRKFTKEMKTVSQQSIVEGYIEDGGGGEDHDDDI